MKREHWYIYLQGSNGETDIENRPMDKVGEDGEGEMYGESNTEIYNTMCKIDSQWEFAVWLRELKQGLCDSLKSGVGIEMGGRSGREGTWVYLWLILVDVWQKTTKFCIAIILQLKTLKKKKPLANDQIYSGTIKYFIKTSLKSKTMIHRCFQTDSRPP